MIPHGSQVGLVLDPETKKYAHFPKKWFAPILIIASLKAQ